MPESDRLRFEASAYVQTLLGRELIRSREAAVVELVKNAYDSGAHRVRVTITPESEKEPGSIEITDDGSGMDLAHLRRVFMVAGYSERPDEVESSERVPTGEKGIGRFASDRLGSRLKVETKTAARTEGILVDINWMAFADRKKNFNEVSVPFYRRPVSFLSTEESGTRLTITGLRESWERPTILSVRDALSVLFNPFETPLDFSIDLEVARSPMLSGEIKSTAIKDPDFDVRFVVKPGGVIERTVRKHSPETSKLVSDSQVVPEAQCLDGLRGRFYYYLKRPRKDQVEGRPPGVLVYRDGFHVEPFGSSRADWLGVGEKRAKRAGHAHIVPSRLFGFVSISRIKHAKLQDTTSREALIETEQAGALVHVLKAEIVAFLEERIRLLAVPRWQESRSKKVIALQQARFQALSVMSSGVAHELRQPLQAIRMDAGNIAERLLQLGIEDPFVRMAVANIDVSIERIDQKIQLISALTGKKLDVNERTDIAGIVAEECGQLRPRIDDLRIDFGLSIPKAQMAIVSDPLVRMVVKNLVENATNALVKVEDGRRLHIRVRLAKTAAAHTITVEDNAMGVPFEVQTKLFNRFATETTGGMGVGLYICQLLLKAHGGEIALVKTEDGVGSTFSAYFVDQDISNAE